MRKYNIVQYEELIRGNIFMNINDPLISKYNLEGNDNIVKKKDLVKM